jgi:hypothetical protein
MTHLLHDPKRTRAQSAYLAAQIVAGVWVFGVVTAGRAVWVGADELRKAVTR